MPAWGELEGGLRPAEIDAVVAYLRQLSGGVKPQPDPRPQRWAAGDAAAAARLYADNCASCHGPEGEGNEGPALANRVFLETATDSYMFETIRSGRSGTSMPAFGEPSTLRPLLTDDEIESVVARIRGWEETR
jgi:cytochrome c oxidase cbb3-type subunit 3